MRSIVFTLSVLFISTNFSCIERRDACITRGHYPDFDFKEIKTDGNVKQEAIFELVDHAGQIIHYKWLAKDTLASGTLTSFEKGRVSLYDYIDSLSNIGFVFELRFDENSLTNNAEEPAIFETSTYWYFVEFEDENRVAKDFVEAVLPIDTKTEAYIAAVSSLTDYDLFWTYEKDEIEPTISITGLDSYRINIPYNITYCDPHQLGLLNIIVSKDGSIQIVENFEDYRILDCICN